MASPVFIPKKSTIASKVPTTSDLQPGEICVNYADAKIYGRHPTSNSIVALSGTGGGGVTSFSAGTTGLTPGTATSGSVTLAGTLAVANGGTGATTAENARTNIGAAASSHTHPLSQITQSGATANQVPVWDGTAWVPQTTSATGGSAVQVFIASGTWTKPAGAKTVEIQLVGGGGGGGSGRKGPTTSARSGGGGGGGAGTTLAQIDASTLGATVSVIIGAGGAGGAAQSTDSTNGNPGTDGGESSFGFFRARGGFGGGGGTATTGSAGSGGPGTTTGGSGGLGGGTSNPGNAAGATYISGGGGGGGNNVLATTLTSQANSGSTTLVLASVTGMAVGHFVYATGVPSGTTIAAVSSLNSTITLSIPTTATIASGSNIIVNTNLNGANGGFVNSTNFSAAGGGANPSSPVPHGLGTALGQGGGGGNGSQTGNGVSGAAGGLYGGGGGGGGSARDGVGSSGAGGRGADGVVIITTSF